MNRIILATFLLSLVHKSIYTLHINKNRIDTIENGWIELMDSSINDSSKSVRFIAKCNPNYILNSNSIEVLPIQLTKTHNEWIPLDDFLIPNLPHLCFRKCMFQRKLPNGFIKSEAGLNDTIGNKIQVHEKTTVKYQCFNGYHLRSLSYTIPDKENTNYEITRTVYKSKILIQRCGINGIESKFNNANDETNLKNINDNNEQIMHYQCFKYCSLFQPDFTNMTGFLAPVKRLYAPGDQLKFMCKEGYISKFPVFKTIDHETSEFELSNEHTLKCSINGTWYLVTGTTKLNDPRQDSTEIAFTNSELRELAQCSSVNSFLTHQSDKTMKILYMWPGYTQLNMRTFSMLFAIAACMLVLLITSIITMRFYTRKRYHSQLHEICSPQLDPLLYIADNENFTSTSDYRTRPQNLPRSQTQAIDTPGSIAFGSIGSSSDLNRMNNPTSMANAYLPSYEEALLQQPISNSQAIAIASPAVNNPPVIRAESGAVTQDTISMSQPSTSCSAAAKNELVINETTSIIEIGSSTLQSLGISGRATRSRSGSIRSNLTMRSTNGSIRTTNSSGTTNSTTSFNLLPPTNSHRHKTNIRTRRNQNFKNLSNHTRCSNRGVSNQTVYTLNSNQESNMSSTSETTTNLSTMTASSMVSNESNASVIPLRGSSNNVYSPSIDSS